MALVTIEKDKIQLLLARGHQCLEKANINQATPHTTFCEWEHLLVANL